MSLSSQTRLPVNLVELVADLPAADVLIITDEQLRILAASPRTACLAGYDRSDLPGLHLGYLVEEQHRMRLLRSGTIALLGRRLRIELSISTGTGTHQLYRVHLCAATRSRSRCLLWTFEPVSEATLSEDPALTLH